jgi:hypothetical protein
MTSKLQEKPSVLQRDHPALQKMNFTNCFIFFWVIFALLDPETPIRIRIRIHNTERKSISRALTNSMD